MKLTILASLGLAAIASAAQVTFTNTKRFLFDVDGNQIDAYGAKVQLFNGTYYLYGNSFSTTGVAYGIKSYSSVDLENWEYEGFITNPPQPVACEMEGGCGRPHIIYNSKSAQYVLWANAGSNGYQVATSASPTGPFVFLNSTAAIDPQFNGRQPADFAVEVINGKGYLVFSSLSFTDPRAGSIWPPIFQTLHLSPLTDDYLNTTLVSYPVTSNATDLIDEEAESPDLFYRNGVYYVAASNTCGYCNGSIGLIYRSPSIKGPWERQIIAGYSCDGQVEGVATLKNGGNTNYVWHSTSVPGGPRIGFGGHIFQPLKFNSDGSVQDLNCAADAQFKVNFQAGKGAVASGAATEAGDESPLDAAYSAVCDSDQFDLFQTWTATESGTLESVSVNVAGAGSRQTVPLALTVFKFDSYADLIAPEYKWTTLGTAAVNGSELSYVFNTTTVAVTANATTAAVKKGDLLGLALSGEDLTPYCYLEYCTSASPSAAKPVLYQRGAGQNSWRGLQGKTSIVYQRVDRSIKFFATYA